MRTRTFAAIESVLSDGRWHSVEELEDLTSFPDEWVRELLLEDMIEVSTDAGTLAPILRLVPTSESWRIRALAQAGG